MSTFWKWYMAVNVIAIVGLGAILVWAAFDIHNRLPIVLLAQLPAILMLAIRKAFYERPDPEQGDKK